MSIKINGTNGDENITKINDNESKVYIIPSLYLNNTEITASGGSSPDPDTPVISPVSIDKCGTYLKSSYMAASEIIIQVPTNAWFVVTNYDTSKNWCEINTNGTYKVADLLAYDGVLVTKASEPEPDPKPTWENVTSEFSPSANPDWAEVKNVSNTTNATDIKVIFKKGLDYDNYDYEIIFHPSILITSYTRVDIQHVEYAPDGKATSFADNSNSISVQVSTVPAPGNTAGINSKRKVLLRRDGQQIAGITLQVNVSMTDEKTLNMRFIVKEDKASSYPSSYIYTINAGNIESIKRKAKVSRLSLRSTSAVVSQPTVIENLVVNNDVLIQGNLSVNGYINDLLWYWDSIAINAIETDLGTGFLAKITDLTFKLHNEQVFVPTLQLSPGSSYKANNYSIIWTSTGALKIDADDITETSGSIQILRYA